MSRKRGVSTADKPIPLSLPFAEDQGLYASPRNLAACAGKTLVLDCETTGLEWWRDKLVGVAVHCPANAMSAFVPCLTEEERQAVKQAVQVIARNPDSRVTYHNNKFDSHFLDVRNWEAGYRIYDTVIMSHLYDSRQTKALGDLEARWLGTATKKRFRGEAAEVHTMPRGAMAEYAINDTRLTAAIEAKLAPELEALELGRMLRKEMAYTRLLQRIEHTGLLVDKEFCQRAIRRFEHNLREQEDELMRKVGRRFAWRSDQELSHALYDWYDGGKGWERPKNPFADADGVDRTRFAHKGKYNKWMTSSFLLNEKAKHPLGLLIMDLRETDKLKSEVEEWLRMMDSNGYLHASFNETGTRTGRLSCRHPNLQNVAADVRVRETQSVYSGGSIREAEYNLRLGLIARPGYTFVSVDAKQQEMRLFAILARVPEMIAAVQRKEDIHGMVARLVWPADCVDPVKFKVRREWSKTIGFGLLYGMTTGSLRFRLNKSAEEADEIIETYYAQFPRIPTFLKEIVAECGQHNMLRYWSGRIWREEDPEFMYKGVNALVQGGSADLISVACMRAQEYLDAIGGDGRVASIIHDELLCEVPTGKLAEAVPELMHCMEVPDIFGMPFLSEAKTGPSYGALKEWQA